MLSTIAQESSPSTVCSQITSRIQRCTRRRDGRRASGLARTHICREITLTRIAHGGAPDIARVGPRLVRSHRDLLPGERLPWHFARAWLPCPGTGLAGTPHAMHTSLADIPSVLPRTKVGGVDGIGEDVRGWQSGQTSRKWSKVLGAAEGAESRRPSTDTTGALRRSRSGGGKWKATLVERQSEPFLSRKVNGRLSKE